MKNIAASSLLCLAMALGRCASVQLGAHQPSLENIDVLRRADIVGVTVGDFAVAADAKPGIDKRLSIRGNSLNSPSNGSFASYLKDSLVAELRSAGKYDPTSSAVISGELTENELNAAGISNANATLSAKFKVHRSGSSVYEKIIHERREWASSFVGAIAIPEAINQYTEMYTRLLTKLFGDEEFKSALSPSAAAISASANSSGR